jgi:hypothetical protein
MSARKTWTLIGAPAVAVIAAATDDALAYSYKTARGLSAMPRPTAATQPFGANIAPNT